MIPKTIHYCWFGGKPLPDDVKIYMESWRKYLPDFEIKQWDESNFDINARLYTRQAYFAGKYAFVSDVARLHALVTEGGIYLDTDILIKRSFPEEWFENEAFFGFEHDIYVQTGVMASASGNLIIREFLDQYTSRKFFKGITYDLTTNVVVLTDLIKRHGFDMNNELQSKSGILLLPQIYLCANDWKTGRYDNATTFAVHDFKGAWGRDVLKHLMKYRCDSFLKILNWHLFHSLK